MRCCVSENISMVNASTCTSGAKEIGAFLLTVFVLEYEEHFTD